MKLRELPISEINRLSRHGKVIVIAFLVLIFGACSGNLPQNFAVNSSSTEVEQVINDFFLAIKTGEVEKARSLMTIKKMPYDSSSLLDDELPFDWPRFFAERGTDIVRVRRSGGQDRDFFVIVELSSAKKGSLRDVWRISLIKENEKWLIYEFIVVGNEGPTKQANGTATT